jgi:CBS domain-containing protein
MRARDVMSNPVTTIGTGATLLEAAKLLVNTRISALPVVEGRDTIVGIVSEIDLIRHVLDGTEGGSRQAHLDDPAAHKALFVNVGEIMTRQVITATEDTELEDVAALMLKHRTKRIPIVRDGSVVGVVSRIDLVKAMLSHTAPDAAPGAGPDDESLRRMVMTAVHRLGIPLGGTFDVVVRHGVAHLWGRVSTEEEDQACQVAAAKVPGIADAISHMQIMPRFQ